MDPHGHIYIDEDENIPAEDKARLDGYLRGRADGDADKRIQALREEMAASLERHLPEDR